MGEVGSTGPQAERAKILRAVRRALAAQVWSKRTGRVESADYQSLFTVNPEPMWIYDLETHRILDVNHAAVEHYGYTREEFLAKTIEDLRPKADVPKLRELIVRLPDSDQTGPWRHLRRDGIVIQVLITSHRVSFGGADARLVMAQDLGKEEPELGL